MKVFKNLETAIASMNTKSALYLNSECPYSPNNSLCGNWCALFYLDKGESNTTPFVILGCKAGEKYLYVEELVEG
jgi:hypothetical protein